VRTLREENAAQRSLDAAVDRWARAMDAWEAATWAIAHDPTAGDPVTESGRTRSHTFEGARSIDMPTVTLIYEVPENSSDYLIIHDALFTDSRYGQAGRG
jgi:hypothetical protein